MSEIYQSSTHGDIPLSFTGRRLLANLREAINNAIAACDFNADDMAVSKARGEIAKRMSELEGRYFTAEMHVARVRALAAAMRDRETRSPEKQAADEFLEAAREFNDARAKLVRCAQQAQYTGLTPTWRSPDAPNCTYSNTPRKFTEKTFLPLSFEVSRVIKKPRVVEDEHVEVMGREP